MVSIPYTSSTHDYLMTDPIFDIRKTPSKMGIITEIFRRRKGVLRSFHPTHPVLVFGKDAERIVEGHENCVFPCGDGSPYQKFHQMKGKVVFYDVPFRNFTFIHYLEDLIKDKLPFPLYDEHPFTVQMVDFHGQRHEIHTHAFSDKAIRYRRPEILEDRLRKCGALKKRRVGKTSLMTVAADDAVKCVYDMMNEGRSFFQVDN